MCRHLEIRCIASLSWNPVLIVILTIGLTEPSLAQVSATSTQKIAQSVAIQEQLGNFQKSFVLTRLMEVRRSQSEISHDPAKVDAVIADSTTTANYMESTAAGHIYPTNWAGRILQSAWTSVTDGFFANTTAGQLARATFNEFAKNGDFLVSNEDIIRSQANINRSMNATLAQASEISTEILAAANDPVFGPRVISILGFDPRQSPNALAIISPAVARKLDLIQLTQLAAESGNPATLEQAKQDLKTDARAEMNDLNSEATALQVQASDNQAMLDKNLTPISGRLKRLSPQSATNQKALGPRPSAEQLQAQIDQANAAAIARQQRWVIALGAQTSARLIKLIGADPQTQRLADQVAATATAYVEISNTLADIKASQNLLAQSGNLFAGPLGAIGGYFMIANVAMNLLSQFGNSGPSPDQIMLEQLVAIRQQLRDMQVQLNERFDQVDSRLNTILSRLDAGFTQTLNGQSVNLTALQDDLAISLSTQDLLLTQANRIAALVNGYFLDPCISRSHLSYVVLDDVTFFNCADRLRLYVTSGLVGEQTATTYSALLPPTALDSTLKTLEVSQQQATYLLDAIAATTGDSLLLGYRPVVNPSPWAQASEWYRSFLLDDPVQTRRVLRPGASYLDVIAAMGRNSAAFKNELLMQLDKSHELDSGTFLNWYLGSMPGVNGSVVNSIVAASESTYAQSKLPPATSPPTPYFHPVPLAKQFQDIPIAQADGQAIAIPNASIEVGGYLSAPFSGINPQPFTSVLPPAVRRAVLSGLAGLRIEFNWRQVDFVPGTCRRDSTGFLYVTTANADVWQIKMILTNLYGLLPNGDVTVFLDDFRVPYPSPMDILTNGGCGYSNPGAFNPQHPELAASYLTSVAPALPPVSEEAYEPQLHTAWDTHRTSWASAARDALYQAVNNSTNPNFAANRRAEKANILMSAIVRFALGDQMNLSDRVYMLGNGKVRIRTITELLALLDASAGGQGGNFDPDMIEDFSELMDIEQQSLRDFLLDDFGFQGHLLQALLVGPTETQATSLQDARELLESPASIPPTRFSDPDRDLVMSEVDNCVLTANASQLDADTDGYGNACDGDLNNSGRVTVTDFTLLRSVLNLPASWSPLAAAADMNGSGEVTVGDYGLLRSMLNNAPGPNWSSLNQ